MRAVPWALVIVALLVSAVSMPPVAAGLGATVTVTASVAPSLSATFTGPGVVVSANAPWQLTAEVPGGELHTVVGDPGLGQLVTLPEGAAFVDVCLL
ncbi:MAG: hypothetical protein ACYCXZ_06840 [Coriobacteriia bacterium]